MFHRWGVGILVKIKQKFPPKVPKQVNQKKKKKQQILTFERLQPCMFGITWQITKTMSQLLKLQLKYAVEWQMNFSNIIKVKNVKKQATTELNPHVIFFI